MSLLDKVSPSGIDVLNIDSNGNYFNTQEAVSQKNKTWFSDRFTQSQVSGSNKAAFFFSQEQVQRDKEVFNSEKYVTSSTVIDSSGNSRDVLSGDNDYYASLTNDIYRSGVEITQFKHWAAGVVQITAGTPGHLREKTLYGVSDTSIAGPDTYTEIDVFDPLAYVGGYDQFSFPILTSDCNQIENTILNGIIEPFAIRPVISNFSTYFPYEPYSQNASLQSGNESPVRSSDSVVSVDYYEPERLNRAWYLDAWYQITLEAGDTPLTSGSLGQSGYLNLDANYLMPFEDVVCPRNIPPVTSSYDLNLAEVIARMTGSGGTTYIRQKQKSATCGFVYDNAFEGTDSIAYGGLLY